MKSMKLAVLAVLVAVRVEASSLPAQLPDFQNISGLTHTAAKKESVPSQSFDLFTGKVYDSSRGVYLFKHRSYDPELMKWTSPDPSGFPDGANNFAYTADPISSFDRDGFMITKFASMNAESFWACYHTYDFNQMNGPDPVYAMVGGELNTLHQNDSDYYDSCALRMDLALYDNGTRFTQQTPGHDSSTYNNGNYGASYITSASGMRTYLDSSADFGTSNSDRTLGNGAQGIQDLINDIATLHDNTNKLIVAIISDGWHVGVITSSDVGYTDPHAFSWDSNHAPRIWVLE